MNLLKRVGTVGGWTLVSRMLGLVRDRMLGSVFGASLILDAFFIAFSLPNLLRNLFGEGALATAFVPRYVQMKEKNPEEAEVFAGIILTRLAVWLGCFAGVGMCVAALVSHYANPSIALIALLAIPQIPYLIFICVSALAAGTLHGRRHFFVPAAAPVLLNISMIIAVFIWQDVTLLPYAVLLTGILQVAVHLVALRHTGGVPALRLKGAAAVTDLGKAITPTIIASGVYQINALLDMFIAWYFLPESGAVTILYFANRLLQFPMALVAHGTGTALYPELAQAASQGYSASGSVVRKGIDLLVMLLLPAACGLYLVAEPLTATIYQAGAFGPEEVRRTALTASMFAFALVPISLNKILIRVFHAHRDHLLPMWFALIGVVVNVCLNVVFVQTSLREAGLALATALSGFVMCCAYSVVLYRRGSGGVVHVSSLIRPVLATTAMAGLVWLVLVWSQKQGYHSSMQLLFSVGAGILLYAVLMGRSLLRRMRR